MLDAEKSMCAFLDHALADPDIAKVPVMIDSSRWNVIEAGLKRLQGKGLVNSINLKDGEAEFLRRAALVRHYGAAVVVMLIDERGQAVSYERKIEIAGRAYGLLVASGFPPQDIVFDPNVLAVATGIAEHDACGLDFIRACTWIRDNCPGVQISGGVTNLSYSFRGNNPLRQAMHSVFLAHAQNAGLTMAIIDPSKLTSYDAIEEKLRTAIEDVILNRNPQAADNLLEIAKSINPSSQSPVPSPQSPDWRNESTEGRIVYAMIHGIDDYIEGDVLELLKSLGQAALQIVEGPLMDGMKEVGKRFDKGTMYLPQVIRSARVMKKAAAALEPFMEKNADGGGGSVKGEAPKVVLATVKGDVHDIGKNIVGVVLACNGYQIIDLGVMVPAEKIIETAQRERAAMIGLSALIAPSLDEMARVAQEMEQRHMNIPLHIGGAAASLVHTSLRLVPQYSSPVVYVPNAGKSAETVRALLSETERPRFLNGLEQNYREAVARHEAIQSRLELLPLQAARANRQPPAPAAPAPKRTGIIDLNDYPLDRVIPYIDWQGFAREWEAEKAPGTLLADAKAMLEKTKAERLVELRGVTGIFPATSDGDDIVLHGGNSTHRLCFLRSQQKKPAGTSNPCLADFVAPPIPNSPFPIPQSPVPTPHSPLPIPHSPFPDWLGIFALSAGFGLDAAENAYRRRHDEYGALLLATLANALAEAFAEEVHLRVRREWWGYAPDETLSVDEVLKGGFTGIRPAFGYPACPDHEDKRIAFELLEAESRCGMKLTESAMIVPAASVCGMFFASPAAHIFGIGAVGDDQLKDWSERKGISVEDVRRRIGSGDRGPGTRSL
jgi:5-methyltetrahydrofolate--homocysteine methyltransferase